MRFKARSLLLVLTFVVTTGLMLLLTWGTFARWRWQDGTSYKAVFSDAAGLETGVDVRASGVAVGSVNDIHLKGEDVVVTFTVPAYLPVTQATEARIRYANLTGDRYLDLTPGGNPDAPALTEGDTIPLQRTRPALDLDTLFAGFDPLMRALDADEVNQLTANILAVSQGQAGAIQDMLAQVGSFTSHLASRDELIGNVIRNLTRAVRAVDDHHDEFDDLVVGLDGLMVGLAKDRRTLGKSLVGINNLAVDTADLLEKVRPDIKANIDQLAVVAAELNRNVKSVEEVLDLYPSTIQRLGRGGAYGSFFNFFVCSVQVKVTLPGAPTISTARQVSEADRCKFPEDR